MYKEGYDETDKIKEDDETTEATETKDTEKAVEG